MQEFIQPLSGKALNLSTHYSLFKEKDLYYLLNGDLQDNGNSNSNWFVQNQLSNELCANFPSDYVLVGPGIKLNNFEYVLFFSIDDGADSEIGVLNTENCSYQKIVSSPCLNFQAAHPVRGIYKFNNNENDRRIYFIDGVNPNRYLDIDQPYPTLPISGSQCEPCDLEYGEELDCDKLRMNQLFEVPCLTLSQNNQGQLLPGTYQVGIAYAEDNILMTDYYFSQTFKVYSEFSNNGLEIEIPCVKNPFSEISIILVSTTRERSLVIYNYGFYPAQTSKITITNTNNAFIIDASTALNKRICYDYSEHICTNDETLLLGKHKVTQPLNYQPQALNIVTKWEEYKVNKKDASKYPSLLRDEVYSFAIEWIDKNGKSKGLFHIPGRAPLSSDLEAPPSANDIYELEDCEPANLKKWQIENTASLENDYEVGCEECGAGNVSKDGYMGYWEAENIYYPNDPDTWGSLSCEPVRHHRMPSHNLTHLNSSTTTTTPSGIECETVEYTYYDEYGLPYTEEYEFCVPIPSEIIEEVCVHVLGVKFYNIEYPLVDGDPDPNIMGYRIWVGDRKGNKSILHKGLIFNMASDTSTKDLKIYYPNYPYNDLNPDPFLTPTQLPSDPQGNTINDNIVGGHFSKQKFTYHSPDIHYRETRNEFGTELKIYGEAKGPVEGKFSEVFTHPKTRLGKGDIQGAKYINHATQLDSLCRYNEFVPWNKPYLSRFQILASQYLLPINQLISDGTKVNNHLRETSYYVSVQRDVDNPTNMDVSRILASEIDGWNGTKVRPKFNYFTEVQRQGLARNLQGVSYYAGVKIKQPDQYGSLEQIQYKPASCVQLTPSGETSVSPTVFAGDVYISRHSLIRKFPLFTQYLSDVPITTETDQREFRNVWYPRFWYDNLTEADDQYNLDGFVDKKSGTDIYALGLYYIWVNGTLDYWCESEFIGDFREIDFTPNGYYYPKKDYPELMRDDLLQYDNKYLYNLSMLADNIERGKQDLTPTISDADFTVIYSKKNDLQAQGDPWLQFLPLNYTILPRTYGSFNAMHPTDMYSIMFGFDDMILYSQVNFSVQMVEGTSLLLGQGDIFSNRLQKLSNEQTGYAGTQDPYSFINTRYGTFFVDRKRKRLFRWSGSLADLTEDMGPWFNKNMESGIPSYDLSLIAVFDNFTENLYLTDKQSRNRWTVSYKPKAQGFISFHSFTPDWYMSLPNSFMSYDSSKSTGVWKHNKFGSYQSYYGTPYPFDIGIVVNNQFKTTEYQSVELFSEWFIPVDFGEHVYTNNFFDQVFAYTSKGTTGIRPILLKNKENPLHSITQNSAAQIPIEVTKVEDSIYRLNKFDSVLVDPNLPVIQWDGMLYNAVNTNENINPLSKEDLKGKWMKLHLISTNNTTNKILVQLLVPNVSKVII